MNATAVTPPNLTFLLGVQRSGSTWLTNIFDAHEDALVFMEPFAPAHAIFPEFPETNFFLEESSPGLDRLLREQMPKRLLHYKRLISERSIRSPSWFRAERSLIRLMLERRRYLPFSVSTRVRRSERLNLNRMDDDAPIVAKNADPSAWVIKELRLAGKVKLLSQAFPDARFVVLVRHPCANVHAICSWFERGRLGELRGDLDTLVAKLASQRVGARYERQLALCRQGTEADRVALHWQVSNEVMVEQLSTAANALIVTYEELATSPAATAARIFGFCGLSASPGALGYVTASSTTPWNGGGPITTLRNAATHFRAWEKKISPELRDRTLEMVRDSPLLKLFTPFYDAAG